MKTPLFISLSFMVIAYCSSCNYITYTPRSKAKKHHEAPSVMLLYKIAEFREEYNEWPSSKEYLTSKEKKYKDAFEGFKFLYTSFNIVNNDKMIFSYSRHIEDEANFKTTKKIDLNNYNGEVKFYKEGGKFIWKIR